MSRNFALFLALALLTGCPKKVEAPPEVVLPPPIVEPPPPPTLTPPPPPQKAVQRFQQVYFDLDGASLDASDKAALNANIAVLQAYAEMKIEVQGHCDERGTTEYNMALGERRASAVRSYLTSNGIAGSRIKTVSYGKERPLSQGSDEGSWSQNRRAEFKVLSGGDAYVQGSTN